MGPGETGHTVGTRSIALFVSAAVQWWQIVVIFLLAVSPAQIGESTATGVGSIAARIREIFFGGTGLL